MKKLIGTCAVLWLLGATAAQAQEAAPPAAGPAAAAAEAPAAAAMLTADQLDQLCGPIALYPDPLLAQILIASAYPLDIVQAARWADANKDKNLTPEALEAALKDRPWDASVKVLIGFPSVLKQLDQNLDWTTALGDAFVNQQADIMESIQVLRAQAKAAGHLESGKEQTITVTAENDITIEPADPEKIYVPQYTAAVYEAAPVPGAAPAPSAATGGTTVVAPQGSTVVTQGSTTVVTTPAPPPPYPTSYASAYPAYSSGDVAAAGLIGFGAGMLVGGLIWNDNVNWNNRYVTHYGYGDNGWGSSSCKNCGNKNSGNTINTGDITINTGNRVNGGNNVGGANGAPWQPNPQRRPTQLPATTATTRPATTAANADGRGYGAGAAARPTAASVQSALGQGGGALNTTRGNDARREADRGRQSLQNSPAKPAQTTPGNAGTRAGAAQQPAAGATRPAAGRPQGGTVQQPAATRPAQANAGRPQGGAVQQPAATRPAQANAGRPQGGTVQQPAATRPAQANAGRPQGGAAQQPAATRPAQADAGGGNRNVGAGGGGAASTFPVGNGSSDRLASQRGQASRNSAATQQPQAGQRQKPPASQLPRPQRGR